MGVFTLPALAQDRSISGKVVGDDGSPLPGVNVLLKGSTNGTVTDAEGSFVLSVPSSGGTLVVSFIGYVTQEVEVGPRSTVQIQLQADVKQLSEVVVVGYGSQLKQDLTGNIARIKGDELTNLPIPSFDQAIQGRAAGVFVEAGNGKLGQGIKVRVRGSSSVSADNQPLYVIDGIPVTQQSQSSTSAATNPLVDINPGDIESIEVLKDASASAIYGSRAANGVVLITTKRGRSGKTAFNVGYMTGFSEPTNKRGFLNTQEYVELFTEANGGLTTGLINRFNRYGAAPATHPAGTPHESWNVPGAPGYVDTNWEDLAFNKDAGINQFDLSANGGTDKTKFFVSGSYSKQKGILVANELERISGRINLDHRANDKLTLGINFSVTNTVNKRLSDDNAFSTPMQIVALSPMTPVIDPRTNLPSGALDLVSGAPNTNFPLYYNPLLDIDFAERTTTVWRNFGGAYAAYNFTDALSVRTEFGYDLLAQNEDNYFGRETARNQQTPNGAGFIASALVFNYTSTTFLRFQKTINESHNLEVIGGVSYQQSNDKYNNASAQQFPSNSFTKITSAASIVSATGQESGFSFMSYFGRANYKFNNKYLLGVSLRADGSSRFGSENRYGVFPAVSAGWILTEESFMSGLGVFEFLKLRASYGTTGNAEIGNFASIGQFGAVPYAGLAGQRPTTLANPELRWERTTQTNVGLDFGFFNNRLTGEFDYYIKNTDDLLINVNLPGTSGYRVQTRNIGSLENRGFEIVINSENLVGALKWSTSFNFARNRNKIINLDGQVIQGSFLSQAREGEPIGIFFGPKYLGVDPANGDALYEIINPDGSKTSTNDYNLATQQKIGDPNPDFIAGLTNNFSFKGIDLSILFQGVFGNQIYNGGGKFMSANGDFFDNQTRDQLRRWRNPGDVTDVPQARLFAGNGVGESSRYMSNGGYLRLRTITLGYSLPAAIISKAKINRARVYVSALNLLTFTDYNGWDPEVNSDTFAGNNVNQGIDFYSAPQPKTITFGINIGF